MILFLATQLSVQKTMAGYDTKVNIKYFNSHINYETNYQ